MENIAEHISAVCDTVEKLLIRKNRQYGNSAFEPIRLFSQCESFEQILVRIDDKLSRIREGQFDGGGEWGVEYYDTILDLIGYLILLLVHRRMSEDEG